MGLWRVAAHKPWREKTHFSKDTDFVFPSVRLKPKKPLSAPAMAQKYLRPAAVKAGVLNEGELYEQSDMELMRDVQGKFPEQLLGDRIHLLTGKIR